MACRHIYIYTYKCIQVLVGPDTEEDGPWYYSLNNRRLWVLKRCREEGLLEQNQIYVRVRPPKSEAEMARYTIRNCSLEAKMIREGTKKEEVSSSPSSSFQEATIHAASSHLPEVTTTKQKAKTRKGSVVNVHQEEDDAVAMNGNDNQGRQPNVCDDRGYQSTQNESESSEEDSDSDLEDEDDFPDKVSNRFSALLL